MMMTMMMTKGIRLLRTIPENIAVSIELLRQLQA